MEELNNSVREDYPKFQSLVRDRKYCNEKQISLDEKRTNRNDSLHSQTYIRHESLSDEIVLMIEAKICNHANHKFKLRCKDFAEKPYFRYDSAGSTHFNRNPETLLIEQQVTTPHFNTYDENGLSFAYKSEKLLDENEAKALEDINLGFIHFCFEANVRYPEDEFCEIVPIPQNQLPLDTNSNDILSNIKFQ